MSTFLAALVLGAGYNTALVSVGAAVLGAAAGMVGAFVLLRKRSLVSDAISHATLPGLVIAFLLMAAVTGDGRSVPALMIGAAASAALGLFAVEWMTRRTRLPEDAAIGAVLSAFFGFGVVLLTVVQTLRSGNQAGLSSYLLGSTAGMLRAEAEIIAITATLALIAVLVGRRPFTLVCFDADYAASRGVDVRLTDLAMMGLVLAVTVIGLRVVGLVLIVALTIIPPVTARFWTDRSDRMAPIAAAFGAAAAYLGTAISAAGERSPTGAVIVLVAFALFVLSMLLSPVRGVLARAVKRRRFHLAVHRRQGLLAVARDERILDPATLAVLRRDGLIRADGVPTPAGRTAATAARRDEARWDSYRRLYPAEAESRSHLALERIETVLPPDLVADLDRSLGPQLVEAGPR